jgi:predicted O-methyltransferase YrrM
LNVKLHELIKNIPRAVKDPRQAIELIWRRIFPFGIKPKDPEAYRIGSWSYGNIPRVPINEVFPGIEGVDVTIFRAFDRDLWTSLDTQEILILSAVVKFSNATNILEIGTYNGNTTFNLAANSPDAAMITTVDLPPDWNGKLELKVPNLSINVEKRTKIGSQFKNTKYEKKIKQIFSDSAKIDWSRLSIPFDIVFIDGCHYYEYVKMDTQNSLRHLKSGGILIWHDYGMYKDVSKVVDETAKKIRVKAIRGTRLAVGFIE